MLAMYKSLVQQDDKGIYVKQLHSSTVIDLNDQVDKIILSVVGTSEQPYHEQ